MAKLKDTALLWLRQDLRLEDNPALIAAAQHQQIIPVYIDDTVNAGNRRAGAASRWWLQQSLQALKQSFNHRLYFFRGDPQQIIQQLVQDYGLAAVYWNRCYEPWQIARDKSIKDMLKQMHVPVESFNSHLLWEPWEICKQDGTPYKVFTPYYRRGCLSAKKPPLPMSIPPFKVAGIKGFGVELEALELMPAINWYQGFTERWQPGTVGAADKLSEFIQGILAGYKQDRNIPSLRGTSLLSPHLHFGEISPRQVWYAVSHALPESNEHLDCFLSELGWREFSYYLLYHFPSLPEKNFQPRFDAFPWQNHRQHLNAWQRGHTGVPIVDAGMRELWQTGYMHNRVRMIVGSFLTKNLLIDWRAGEQWFWDCLLDADLASNSASWQWVAGCGADAAPYFRIFNPVTQGEKFDPHGEYVRTFCPELAQLPDKYLHAPWQAPAAVLQQTGIQLGRDYPQPIVDIKLSRQRALDVFKALRGSAAVSA